MDLINSWHMNEHESAAMWRLYARTNEAIAIRSTYQRLYDCLPPIAYVGVVRYHDYDAEWMAEGNTLYPYVHKLRSFEHEKELRAVIQDLENLPTSINPDTDGSTIQAGIPNPEVGKRVEVSITDLVETIYVSPTAPDWFRDLVEAVTVKYGLANKPVIRSSLDDDPVY